MRLRGAQQAIARAMAACAVAATLAGCGGGGWLPFGKSDKSPDSDPTLVSKPLGPGLVDRCPVPVAYDDATLNKIQAALDALPKDNILHKAMSDYETERDNLRMCH
jgi:predicted small lipoprotein YifL